MRVHSTQSQMAKCDGLDFECTGGKSTPCTVSEAQSSSVAHTGISKFVGFNLFYASMGVLISEKWQHSHLTCEGWPYTRGKTCMHTQTHTLSLMHMTQVAVRYQSVRVCQGVAHVCVCMCVCVCVCLTTLCVQAKIRSII
jgi:hypothetical protein